MLRVLGVLMAIAGCVLGLYVGVYVCFIGGIVDILEQIKVPGGVHAPTVAWGIAKIVFASCAGVASAVVLIFPGIAMAVSGKR